MSALQGNQVTYALASEVPERDNGQWRRLVARFVRDEEVVGSNPATPTLDGAGALAPAPSISRRFPEEAR